MTRHLPQVEVAGVDAREVRFGAEGSDDRLGAHFATAGYGATSTRAEEARNGSRTATR
jgi:hypothetical protein